VTPDGLLVECACGNQTKFPRTYAGRTTNCTHCGAQLRIPEVTKPCPFCAESIQAGAVKCRHCGEFIDGRPRHAPIARPTTDPGGVGILVMGILALVLNVCGAILGPIAWVMGNNYIRDCQARRIQPSGMGTAGRICGIIATILWGGLVAFYVLIIAIVGIGTGFK